MYTDEYTLEGVPKHYVNLQNLALHAPAIDVSNSMHFKQTKRRTFTTINSSSRRHFKVFKNLRLSNSLFVFVRLFVFGGQFDGS